MLYIIKSRTFMRSWEIAYNGLRLAAGGEIEFPSARTVAKFIIKSSLFILSLNRDSSAQNYRLIMLRMLIVISSPPLAANRCKLHFCLICCQNNYSTSLSSSFFTCRLSTNSTILFRSPIIKSPIIIFTPETTMNE